MLDGKEPQDLNECCGYFDKIREYHYHVGKPGTNQIIQAYHGEPVL